MDFESLADPCRDIRSLVFHFGAELDTIEGNSHGRRPDRLIADVTDFGYRSGHDELGGRLSD